MAVDRKKLNIIIQICIAAILAVSLVAVILIKTGKLNKNPKVSVFSEVSDGEVLRVITDANYSPYSFKDGNGNISGYDIELITIIANELGMKLEILTSDNMNEAKSMLKGGGAEVLMACDRNDEIEDAIMSVSTSIDDFVVYSKVRISSVDQLFRKKIAVSEDGFVLHHLEILGLIDNCRYYEDNEQAMRAVARGEADCAIMRANVGSTFLQKIQYSNISEQISVGQSYMCFGIRGDREDLAININRAIEKLRKDGVTDELEEKWLTTFVKPYSVREVLRDNPWVLITVLVLVLYTFYSIYRRNRISNREHEEQRKQLNEKLQIIGGISSKYNSLYYLDLNDGSYINYVKNSKVADEKSSLEKYTGFMEYFNSFVDGEAVHPDSREQLHGFIPSEAGIREELDGRKKISTIYRQNYGGEYLWTEMVMVKCEDIREEAQNVIIGTVEINDEYLNRQKAEENERQAKTTKTIINRFVTEFEVSYIVDIKKDTFKIIKNKIENSGFISSTSFSEVFLDYAARVYEEDRELLKENIKLETINERIQKEPEYFVRYRGVLTGRPVWYEMRILKLNESEIILGFMNVDETLMKQNVNMALTGNYYDVYALDIDYDVLKVVRYESNRLEITAEYGDSVYSEVAPEFISCIHEKYRHEWELIKTPEGVRTFFGNEDKRELVFESAFCEGRYIRCSWFVLRRKNGLASKVCFAFSDLDEKQTDREKLNEKIAEQGAFTSYFLEAYRSAYYVSLDNLSYQIYKRTNELNEKYVLRDNFFETLSFYVDSDVHPDDRDELKELVRPDNIREMLKEQNQFYHVFREGTGDTEKTVRLQVIRGADERHAAFGFRDITKNIREQEFYQRQLQDALSEAQSANRAKTSFLFNMSHDIRTPMNAIIGFTDMAVKRIDDKEKVLDYLSKVKQSGTLLLSLINGVLDMSRIESGKAELDENPGDVYLAFSVIEDSMTELAKQKDISISFTFGDIQDRYVFCDFSRTTRIMVNLVSNAIKYTNAGGTVEVSCEQTGRKDGSGIYRFIVKDNGIGMSEEFVPHVFEAYSREHNTTTSKVQGTGLGLSVCKTFAEAMGGTIECSSRQGEGSTFTVILPFKIQQNQSYTDPATGEIIAAEPYDDMKISAFSGKRVLLVEDNDLNREIAIDLLSEVGFVVDEADDGTVAVRKIDEVGPCYYDFVLMDIQMPTMNGYEATGIIRERYPDAYIPIIALSANAFAEDRKASIEAGMNAHIAKPIDVRLLLETMRKLLK